MDSILKFWIFCLLLHVNCRVSSASGCICQPIVNVPDTHSDCEAIKNPASFDLYFTEETTKDFVIHHGLSISNAFTVCYRMRTTEKSTDRTVFSFASQSSPTGNEILLITRANKMALYIDGSSRDSNFAASEDGSWHHICLSWENTQGEFKLYRDGVLQSSGVGLKKGHVINSAGTLVIGQEQDNVGGGFDAKQCYIGELTDLNVWDQVLSADRIGKMSRSCHGFAGNVKKWADFRAGIRGSVKVLSPSACEP